MHRTAEPSTSPIGTLARALTDSASGTVLACLYAADRYHHLAAEISPHLAAGQVVISDRYLASGLVMQRLDGLTFDYLLAVNAHAAMPDLAVVLTATTDTVRARLTQRGAHNRDQHRRDSTAAELRHFADAAAYLERRGGTVLLIDTTHREPALVVAAVLDGLDRNQLSALEA